MRHVHWPLGQEHWAGALGRNTGQEHWGGAVAARRVWAQSVAPARDYGFLKSKSTTAPEGRQCGVTLRGQWRHMRSMPTRLR